jgi:sterol desaturase/sphingolipid hydroxylase (fatty acid hydroxylase superfamily)
MWETVQWFIVSVMEYSFSAFASRDNFVASFSEIRGTFTDFGSGFAWPYLLASLLVVVVAYTSGRRNGSLISVPFKGFLVPRRVYGHVSAKLDYRYYIASTFLNALLITPMLIGLVVLGKKVFDALLSGSLGWSPPATLPVAALFAASLAFYLLYDLAAYWNHRLFHHVPLLWTFHKVHHSAEVLTPISAYRAHPMEFVLSALVRSPVAALAVWFYQNISPHDLEATLLFGVSFVGFSYGLTGYHLQHSHLPISYGAVVNRIIASPVMHQIHHSAELLHFDKNFGVKFMLWDCLFGTLYAPVRPERFSIGIQEPEFRQYRSVSDMYLRPITETFRMVWQWMKQIGRLRLGASQRERRWSIDL